MTEGKKNDEGKLRYDLIPAYALDALAGVYTTGAEKYDDRNWELGINYGRVFGALMRHAWVCMRGVSEDPDDGQHPLMSVAWCAFALYEYERRGMVKFDDRPVEQVKRPRTVAAKGKKRGRR